jgi:hypothetical protein
MGKLLVSPSVSLILAMLDGDFNLLFHFFLNLNSHQVQGVDAVEVQPGLCRVEINHGFPEVFQNVFHVTCVLFSV